MYLFLSQILQILSCYVPHFFCPADKFSILSPEITVSAKALSQVLAEKQSL